MRMRSRFTIVAAATPGRRVREVVRLIHQSRPLVLRSPRIVNHLAGDRAPPPPDHRTRHYVGATRACPPGGAARTPTGTGPDPFASVRAARRPCSRGTAVRAARSWPVRDRPSTARSRHVPLTQLVRRHTSPSRRRRDPPAAQRHGAARRRSGGSRGRRTCAPVPHAARSPPGWPEGSSGRPPSTTSGSRCLTQGSPSR